MKYNLKIGSGKILEGSATGNIHFHFNENGLVIHIPDTEQYFSKKNIDGISFKTTIRDKIKKGSTLAKTAAFMAATNKNSKNVGSQIATSQRFADMGRDSVVQEETKIGIIDIRSLGQLVIDLGSDASVQKKLVLAYNNPRSFFIKSVKDQKSHANVVKSADGYLKLIVKIPLWVMAVGGSRFWFHEDISNDPFVVLFAILCSLLLVYLIYPHTKWGKKTKTAEKEISKNDIVLNFENSQEYKQILKNLS